MSDLNVLLTEDDYLDELDNQIRHYSGGKRGRKKKRKSKTKKRKSSRKRLKKNKKGRKKRKKSNGQMVFVRPGDKYNMRKKGNKYKINNMLSHEISADNPTDGLMQNLVSNDLQQWANDNNVNLLSRLQSGGKKRRKYKKVRKNRKPRKGKKNKKQKKRRKSRKPRKRRKKVSKKRRKH